MMFQLEMFRRIRATHQVDASHRCNVTLSALIESPRADLFHPPKLES